MSELGVSDQLKVLQLIHNCRIIYCQHSAVHACLFLRIWVAGLGLQRPSQQIMFLQQHSDMYASVPGSLHLRCSVKLKIDAGLLFLYGPCL